MNRTAVINVVGLSESLLGPATPRLNAFRAAGASARIRPAFPAVTCTAQANYLTGVPPAGHGIVANGWYDRQLAEVHFWKQSNHLVTAPKIWDHLRSHDPHASCAQLFWWFNMYSGADWSITPRPMYPADGRKVFDIYCWPYSIRTEIKRDLGDFPFATFWGPAAGVASPAGPPDGASRWIAASAKWIEAKLSPTLNLVYLPHLDYNLQRLGPSDPRITEDLKRIDQIAGDLIDFFGARSVQVILVSEYGIEPVDTPVHLNRLFREKGWLVVKEELGLELLDSGASRAFAVADHQVAHIYVQDKSLLASVRDFLEKQSGIAKVLDGAGKHDLALDHPRSGDLVAIARGGAWFTYYYWLDDARAPDFSRTVDIHRKPGFDPVELFLDRGVPFIKARIAWRLLQKRLGLRMLMDVTPLDASLVKGSHGRDTERTDQWPLLITGRADLVSKPEVESTGVHDLLLQSILR